MEHLINFIGYMTFSGLEFLTIFLMICSVFSINLRDYIKEIALGATLVTFVSYINVIFMIDKFNLMPLFAVIVITYSLKRNFGVKRLSYAIAASVGGVLIYGIVQFGVALLGLQFELILESELSTAFSMKSYLIQSVCISLGLVICLYIRCISGGFGFEFRGGKFRIFTIANIFIILIMMTASTMFLVEASYRNVLLLVIITMISFLIFLNLAIKRESYEFAREGVSK